MPVSSKEISASEVHVRSTAPNDARFKHVEELQSALDD